MKYKYDVFISYSRCDYIKDDTIIPNNPISRIMELLDNNHVSYWIDKEGILSGQQFVEVITEAITNSMMLVFVSSESSNASKWTANEIFEAYDEGKLIIPVKIDNSEYNKKYRMIVRPFDFIDYNNQPNSALPSLLKAVKNEKGKIEEIEKQLQIEKEREKIVSNISSKIKELQGLMGQQAMLLKEIYANSNFLGLKTKVCPVCKSVSSTEASFCTSCGWQYSPLYGVYSVDSPFLHDEIQLRIVRNLWENATRSENYKVRIETLEEENKKLNKTLVYTQQLFDNAYKEIGDYKQELKETRKSYEDLLHQNTTYKHQIECHKTDTKEERLRQENQRKVLKPIEQNEKYGGQIPEMHHLVRENVAEQPRKVYETKAEVLRRVQDIAHGKETPQKEEVDYLKTAFYKLHIAEREAKLKAYLDAGGDLETYQITPDMDEEKFKAEMGIIKERRAKIYKELEAKKQENLTQKMAMADPEQRTQRQQYTESKKQISEEQQTDSNQAAAAVQDTQGQPPRTRIIKDKLPGRNDPCPCGSGKKFKNCHGRGIV